MPIEWWSNNLFKDRIDFRGELTREEVREIIALKGLRVLQCVEPANLNTWELLNNEFFANHPEIELRVYGFYSKICDLSFTSRMTNVEHFSADCLKDAVGVEHIASMLRLKSLSIGIYHLQDFDFLKQITTRITKLFLGRTSSKKPDLSPLSRFANLEKIYIEGQQKNIEVLSALNNLREVILRSISTPDLSYLKPLSHMWSLDIKLGGIKNINAIEGMENIKYLELWQINGLSDLSVISSLVGLQNFFLQSLAQVHALPPFGQLIKLRRIHLDNLKGLEELSVLKDAPSLEEFIHTYAQNMQPEDYLPLLSIPTLKRVFVAFGSDKKNKRFAQLARDHNITTPQVWDKFEFV